MKRLFLSFYAVFFFGFSLLFGQSNRLYEEIQAIKQSGQRATHVQPFHTSQWRSTPGALQSYVKEATILSVDKGVLQTIRNTAPDFIAFDIPSMDGAPPYELELMKESPFMPSFEVVDADSRPVDYHPGVYYRGIIKGDRQSVVAISFFEDDVIGVMSPLSGNLVIGKWKTNNREEVFLVYKERDLLLPHLSSCEVDDTYEVAYGEMREDNREGLLARECKTIAVYLEADYYVFQKKGRSVQSATNYITGLYNVVSTLYANEGINTKINKLKVWNKRDPYNYSSSNAALSSFGSRVGNNFDGDLAHLLSLSPNNLGGLAWVDVLCKNQRRHAFSNIGAGYTEFPTYSWSAEVVTHEMGHNVGSRHTQHCSWGPRHNQALDNCVATEGGCPRGPAPKNGGTIMSYCHLTRYGINFRNGFGPEPGDLIRNRVRGASCLGTAFVASIAPKGTVNVYYGDSTVLSASPTGSKYTYQWYRSGLALPGATNSTLVVKESGIYFVEVTTTCSVIASPVKVVNSEFLASINYPPVQGGRDSVREEVMDTIIGGKTQHYEVSFGPEVYRNIPDGSHQWYMQMIIQLKGGFPTYLNRLKMTVRGPANSGILLEDFYPADGVDILVAEDTFNYNLGRTNPTGTWQIDVTNENKNSSTVKPIVFDIDLAFVWVLKSRPSDQNVRTCAQGKVTLDAGVKADSYLWSTGEKTRQIIALQPGNYAVTATKGSLESSDDIDVIIAPTDYEISQTICEGETYLFGQQSLSQSGTYHGSFTSSAGCDSVVTLHLEVSPTFYKEESLLLCFGDEFQGKKYYRSDTLEQYLHSAAGCDSTRIYYIRVSPQIIAAVEADTSCPNVGSRVKVFSNNPDDTYLWSNGKTKSKIYGVKEDSISVTITNPDGCQLEKTVEVPHYPVISLEAEVRPISCFGDRDGSIRLIIDGGSGKKTIRWNDGFTGLNRSALGEAEYLIMVEDEKGCKEEKTVRLVEPDSLSLSAQVQDTRKGLKEGSIVLTVDGGTMPYKYQWSNGATTKDLQNIGDGKYSVLVTDNHQCQKNRSYIVGVDNAVKALVHSPMLLKARPSPAHSVLYIEGRIPGIGLTKLIITEVSGKPIFEKTYKNSTEIQLSMDVSHWAEGVYLIQLNQSGKRIIKRISIVH